MPKEIARGKFMAAYTTIALYIVVLAPVGALSFLFGGVTALEVVVAFLFLFLIAALAVAFGLAVSSLMSSLRGAIVVTLMLAICIGPFLYVTFGFGASFGFEYVLVLFGLPLLLVFVPAWFLYETTISN